MTITMRNTPVEEVRSWANAIVSQAWPGASVGFTALPQDRAVFTIVPPETEQEAFIVDTSITLPLLEQLLSDSTEVAITEHAHAVQHEVAARVASERHVAHHEGFLQGCEAGERRGRNARNEHAREMIAHLQEQLDDAQAEIALCTQLRALLEDTSATDTERVALMRLALGIAPVDTAHPATAPARKEA
ncbi:hypothetical protein ACXR2T_10105 [Leucobacter sp. HY1910]